MGTREGPGMTPLELLRELVACKDGRQECSRQRQRRPHSVTRKFPQELLEAEAMWKAREAQAWEQARRHLLSDALDTARLTP